MDPQDEPAPASGEPATSQPPPKDPAARRPVTADVEGGVAKLMPDLDRPRGWLLTVDGAPQSYVDLDDPEYLEFEYVVRVAHVLDTAAEPGEPLDVLHLGGGALSLPRYVAAVRPGSRQRVVENDGRLLDLVAEHLPWQPGIEVCPADARAVLEATEPASVDVVVADVFRGSRVPAHLTTVEYVAAAARALRPGGRYLANLADGPPFTFLRSQLATLRTAFAERCLIAEPAVLRGRRFGNTVLVASQRALPVRALARRAAGDAFPARVEHGAGLARFESGGTPARDAGAVPSPEPPPGAFSVG